MLLNEFLKEHKKVEQQSREIQEQKTLSVGSRREWTVSLRNSRSKRHEFTG